MVDRQLFINGSYQTSNSDKWIEIENPATKDIISRVPRGDDEDVIQAVNAAYAAQPAWAASSINERISIMRRFHDSLRDQGDDIVKTLQDELGAPSWYCEIIQYPGQLDRIQRFIEIAENYAFQEEKDGYTILREPYGVVAALTPWNFPLGQIIPKIVPAILTGNTVVLKPSQYTPLTAYRIVEAFIAAELPSGVFNLVTGRGAEVGNNLATNPKVGMITFTGSTAGGLEVSRKALDSLKPVTLELGGKSPAIFLDDTNLAGNVEVALDSIFGNSGQVCDALSRIVVVRDVKEKLETEIKKIFPKYTVGKPADNPFLGPLVSSNQFAKVSQFIKNGKERLDVLVGEGKCDDSEAYYCSPIVFTNVDENDEFAQEEIFGPVLVIIEARDEADAVRIANNSKYGLSAAVFGKEDAAWRVARQIESGQVKINQAKYNGNAPFGGYKQSGRGREGDVPGFEEFLQMKVILS